MKDRIKNFSKDRFVLYSTGAAFIFFVISLILVLFSYSQLPPLVPILNSMPWGIGRLYDSSVILLLPLVMIVVIFVNTTVSLFIYRRFTLLGRIISFNSLLFCLLATLAYLQILFLIY